MFLFELVIILIGLTSLIVTIFLFYSLRRIGHKLSIAVSYMILAEMITNLATLVFAVTAILGWYETIPPLIAGGLRLAIFVPITGSSIYLFWTCFRTELGPKDG